MREIKFRVWDNSFKKMYDNNYWLNHPSGQEDFFNIVMYRCAESQFNVMQYIGVKDKNGNEIYEGDIVTMLPEDWYAVYDGDLVLGIVQHLYNEPEFYISIDFENSCDANDYVWYGDYGQEFSWDCLTVLGNIYENSDLLKKKNEQMDFEGE